jgi:hypothetical protein
MDGLVLASIAFLSTIFCVIGGFIIHVFISERNSRRARETLEAMGLNEENQQRRTRENRSNNTENNGVESDDVDRGLLLCIYVNMWI